MNQLRHPRPVHHRVESPFTIAGIRTYVAGARASLLRRKSLRGRSDLPLFLSWRTGKQIHPDSITNLFASKQKEAGVTRASPQHLRSKGATDRVERLLEMYEQRGAPLPDEETLLLQVQELLGHASPTTSRRYIRREKKRRLDRMRSEQWEVTERTEKLKQLDREIAIRRDQLRRIIEQTGAHTAGTPKP